MKVKKVLGAVILLGLVFILTGEPANKASPQNINLVSSSINDAFRILWENKKQTKENSVTADMVISNLTGTWFQVELEFNQSQHNVVVSEDKIPYVFLMGPYQKKTFKNIEFFDMQVLQFDARRSVKEAYRAYLMLCIDMIDRGLFGEPFTIDNCEQLSDDVWIEIFKTFGEIMNDNDSYGPFVTFSHALATRDFDEAAKSFAEFILSLKNTKREIWRLIKVIYGEKNSILKKIEATSILQDVIDIIEFPKKAGLMESLYYNDLVSPTDDQFWLTARSNIPKLPQVKIASPLRFTPNKSTYYVGDVITADFGLDNGGSKAIALRQVLVGGRGPGKDDVVYDFTSKKDINLDLNTCYQYQGTLKLTKPGKYHFFCAYQTIDEQWDTSINLSRGLIDANRIKDIEVVQLTVSTSFKPGDKVKVISNLGLWLRSSPEIINEESKNKIILNPMPLNTELTIIGHLDNGIANDGYYWWLVQHQAQQGWCAEADYRRTNTFLSLILMTIPLGAPGKPIHVDQ